MAVCTDADNQQKYLNYCEQMRRLKKALGNGFCLEAIFIEYAILEDRLESASTHANAFNTNKQGAITAKTTKLEKLCELIIGDEDGSLLFNKRGLNLLAEIEALED